MKFPVKVELTITQGSKKYVHILEIDENWFGIINEKDLIKNLESDDAYDYYCEKFNHTNFETPIQNITAKKL